MAQYQALSLHHHFEALSQEGEITRWRTQGLSGDGRIFGEVSPVDFQKYSINGFFEFLRFDAKPRITLGFSEMCRNTAGNWIGRMAHFANRRESICELRDHTPVESSQSSSMNEYQEQLRRILRFHNVRLIATTEAQGRVFGTTQQNTATPQIPWFVDSNAVCHCLPAKGKLGAIPLFVDDDGVVWGQQQYAGKTFQPGFFSAYQLCRWHPDGNDYRYEPMEELINGADTLCPHVMVSDARTLILGHAHLEAGKVHGGISFLDVKTGERQLFPLSENEQLIAIFGHLPGEGLVYSSAPRNDLSQITLRWLPFAEKSKSVPLKEKLGEIDGVPAEYLDELVVRGIDKNGNILVVARIAESPEKIWLLEPVAK